MKFPGHRIQAQVQKKETAPHPTTEHSNPQERQRERRGDAEKRDKRERERERDWHNTFEAVDQADDDQEGRHRRDDDHHDGHRAVAKVAALAVVRLGDTAHAPQTLRKHPSCAHDSETIQNKESKQNTNSLSLHKRLLWGRLQVAV